MKHLKTHFEHIFITSHLLRWTLLVTPVSLTAGSLIAFFLWLQRYSVEGDNSKIAICVRLVDKKEKLQTFFHKHKDLLRSKIVIFKEVEFWDVD
jgi:hypothetical protein